MSWLEKCKSLLGWGKNRKNAARSARLLALAEKRELETMLRGLLQKYHDQNGPAALLQPDVFVVLDSQGARVQQGRPEAGSYLATVETCKLPSAVSLMAVDLPNIVVPGNVVKFFGTEAASALAAEINRTAAPPPADPGS